MISYFSWNEFDKAVEHIANKCKSLEFSGIYGVPRGGLCLAVALSHKLKIELISEPIKNSLIVDDVYETGITLTSYKNIEGAMFFVLFSKNKPTWWNTGRGICYSIGAICCFSTCGSTQSSSHKFQPL